MTPVVVKKCVIGAGAPKIIVPIVAPKREDILKEAAALHGLPVDLVEWRMDWYEDVEQAKAVVDTAAALQNVLGELPLLVTFRTAAEGGERAMEPEAYGELMKAICRSGQADLIDVELFLGEKLVSELVEEAHAHGVKVVLSNHEWHMTPPKEEIVARLQKMKVLGADIPKMAVMPQKAKDVLTLLSATEEAAEVCDCPLITMAMGGKGVISRLAGECFGSAATFGAAAKASAPGQVGVQELKAALDIIHNSL